MKPYLRMIFMFAATAAAVGCTHVADKRPNHITVVVKSFWPQRYGHSSTVFLLHWAPAHGCACAA